MQQMASGNVSVVPRSAGSLATLLAQAQGNGPAQIGFRPPLRNVPAAGQFPGMLPADTARVRSSPAVTPTGRQHSPSGGSVFPPSGEVSKGPIYQSSFGPDPRGPGAPQDLGTAVGAMIPLLSFPHLPKLGQLPQAAADVLSPKYRALARAAGMGEGDYEAHNSGTLRDKILNGVPYGAPAGTVTGKTINEIMATYRLPVTDPKRLFAVGTYQITPEVLREAKDKMKLTGNELMTPAIQDRIFAEFLLRRELKALLKDPKIPVDRGQLSAAHQWASIAVPKGYPIKRRDAKGRPILSDGTMSFYGSGNSANMDSTRELRRILEGWHQPAGGSGRQPSPDIGR
jgi:hypothetical protein